MKITCSACHASYNLPDDKVAGRRVKVRCKRCAEPIIVDGSRVASIPPPPEEEDEATRVMDSPLSSPAAMWTVNLSDTEQGDMTDEELVAGWQAGIVTEDAYVWREGMDDWRPILDVPELISLLSQATRPEPLAEESAAEESDARSPAPPATATPTPDPPKAAAFPSVPRPPKADVSSRRPDADLFAQKPKPRREKPKYEASQARNENSVLFSLDALKAAAEADEEAPKSTRVDEDLLVLGGSGMGGIDLFNAPLIQVEAPAASPNKKAASRGPSVAGFGAELDDSFQAPRKSGLGWLWGLVAGVAIAGGGWYAYTNVLAPQSATTADPSASAVPADEAPSTAEDTKPEATDETSEAAKPEATDPVSDETVAADKRAETARDGAKNDRQPSTAPDKASETSSGKSPIEDKPPSSTGSSPSKDDKGDEEDEDKEGADNPPFNTEAARAALNGAAAQAASCKATDGPTGSGKVQVTFVNSGRVTSANVVSGPFGGTAVGGCVARTFRQARVPAFSGDAQIVSKSFSIPE